MLNISFSFPGDNNLLPYNVFAYCIICIKILMLTYVFFYCKPCFSDDDEYHLIIKSACRRCLFE